MDKKKKVREYLGICAGVLGLVALLVGGVISSNKGGEYLAHSKAGAQIEKLAEDFEDKYYPEDIRDESGAIVSKDYYQPGDDSDGIQGFLDGRGRLISQLEQEMKAKGKIGFVITATWQIKGGYPEAPMPTVFIFN